MNIVPLVPAAPEPTFDQFWLLMVKKSSKYETKQEWAKLSPEDRLLAMTAAALWRPLWLRTEQEYLLHPNRWLKRRRYEDELPQAVQAPVTAAHQPAVLPAGGERSVMPDKIRAQLANFRFKG